MRAKEFIKENASGLLSDNVREAMPATYVLPDLRSQDPYLQYRFGLALASARAKAQGELAYNSESAFGEDMVVVARSKEEQETLAMALALFGKDNASRLVSTETSDEPKDTNKRSPIVASKKIQSRS
jgi:hypothetical protein